MQVDGYIRVSRVGRREGHSFMSPKIQRERIQAWADFRGAEILRFHTDLDQSGTRMDRPGLRRAMARVKGGRSDGIVVARLDRFARSLPGALEAIKELDEAGGTFVSIAEDLDPTTPVGKMMMRSILVMAEFEVDRLRESWDDARRHAVARGVHPANRSPTGYRRGGDGRLEPDPRTAPHIVNAIRSRAAFASWPEIRRELEVNDVRGASGATSWTSNSLAAMISNRAYLGEARSGAYLNRHAHPPIVDRGTWEAAQRARTLGSNRATPTVLGGLLRCATCRRLMRSGVIRGRRGGTTQLYWCADEPGVPLCPKRQRISAPKIEPLVADRFFALIGSSAMNNRVDRRSLRLATDSLVETERLIDGGEESISQLLAFEAARERLVRLTRSRLLPDRADLRQSWTRLTPGERRRCIALVIETVFIRNDRGRGLGDRVLALPPERTPTALPSGRRATLVPFDW